MVSHIYFRNRVICIMNNPRRNESLLVLIAKRLKELRNERDCSQDDVYIDTDIHIARIETGKRNITVSTLSDLCAYYGVTLDEFFAPLNYPPKE